MSNMVSPGVLVGDNNVGCRRCLVKYPKTQSHRMWSMDCGLAPQGQSADVGSLSLSVRENHSWYLLQAMWPVAS